MKLKKLQVTAGGGINPKAPIIIDFSQSKFVKAVGDNGVNKTSLLEALLMACGQLGGKKQIEKYTNLESGKIDIDFEFVGNDKYTYTVKVTKSTFKLMYEGEAVPEPMTKIKELLGVVGVSPMYIKDRPIEEIVKWLAAYSTKGVEEYEKLFAKAKINIKTARERRAAANRIVNAHKEYLTKEPLAIAWEETEARFVEEPNIKKISAELEEAGKKSDRYIRAEEKLKRLNQDRPEIVNEIKKLEKELKEKEAELVVCDESIKAGAKYIDDNKNDKKEYDAVKKRYDTAAQDIVDYNKWLEIKRKKTEMDAESDKSIKADNEEKELVKNVADLQAEILPDIKDVKIVMEDTHEDNGTMVKEGFYRKGISSAAMSETEWIGTVMEIWKKNKVKIIILDNLQSLGSYGMETLGKLEKDGCYILAAEMNRSVKTIEIEYQ